MTYTEPSDDMEDEIDDAFERGIREGERRSHPFGNFLLGIAVTLAAIYFGLCAPPHG